MAVQALRDLAPAAPTPRGAPATIPHYPAPRFPTIPRAAYKLALVSPASTVGGAGRPTRHSSRRRCAARKRRPFWCAISTRAWFRAIMAAQLSGKSLGRTLSLIQTTKHFACVNMSRVFFCTDNEMLTQSLDKALQNIASLRGEQTASRWHFYLTRIQQMPNANRTFKRIASTSETEQLGDYLAEVLYALVFAGLGFHVEIEPHGIKGPDLRISRDGLTAVVEIMRLRKINPGPPVSAASISEELLETYGNPHRDIRKAFTKLISKFPQTDLANSIIAIWNDDEDLEEIEVELAVRDILSDAQQQNLTIPHGLSFILYGSSYWGRQQLYCFTIRDSDPVHQNWQQELESLSVNQLVQRACQK